MSQQILLILSWVVIVVGVRRMLGANGILIIFAISWWFFWNLISNLSISGFYQIGIYTQFIYFVFFYSLLLGIYLRNKILVPSLIKYLNNSIDVTKREKLFFNFLLFIILPIALHFLIRTVYLLNTKFNQSTYRSEVFGLLTGRSELFYNSYALSNIYWLILHPIYWMGLVIGMVSYFKFKNKRILILSILLFLIDSITTVGRFGIHHSIIVLLALGSISNVKINFSILKNKIFWQAIIFFVACIFLFMFIRRGPNWYIILNFYFIGYHTASFSIFDLELQNPNSMIYDKTLGSTFFGGILNIPRFLYNYFYGYSWIGEVDKFGGYLHENRLIGYNKFGIPLYFNAFGSIFSSMYRDGAIIGIFIYGVLFGYIMGISSRGIFNKKPKYLVIHIIVFLILIYGIFQPFTGGAILTSLVFILFFYSFPNYKKNK